MKDFEGSRGSSPGGASGIGAATAALLGDRGARVAVVHLNPSGAPDECLRITVDTTDDTAVRAAVRRVAVELGGLDVLVEATGDPAAELAALEARQPIGRLVSPEEVANAISYLASPPSGSTDTVLGVDGGMVTLRLPR